MSLRKDKGLNRGFAPLAILGILALVGAGTAGGVVASDSARPGDSLFAVDQAVEGVRLAFAGSPEAQARIQNELALERIEEASSLAGESGRVANLEDALSRAQNHIASAQSRAEEARSRGLDTDEVLAVIAQNSVRLQETLAEVHDRVPDEAKPAIERSLEESQRGFEEAAKAISGQKQEEVINESMQRLENVRQRVRERGVDLPEIEIPERPNSEGGGEAGGPPAGVPSPARGRAPTR